LSQNRQINVSYFAENSVDLLTFINRISGFFSVSKAQHISVEEVSDRLAGDAQIIGNGAAIHPGLTSSLQRQARAAGRCLKYSACGRDICRPLGSIHNG
jgi:hypothetical protein